MSQERCGRACLSTAAFALAASALSGPTAAQVGTRYCSPATSNASGLPGQITAVGSADLALNGNQLILVASSLPRNTFGIFVTSRTPDFIPNPGGSLGTLCLGLPLGRYVAPGQVLGTGGTGVGTFCLWRNIRPRSFLVLGALSDILNTDALRAYVQQQELDRGSPGWFWNVVLPAGS